MINTSFSKYQSLFIIYVYKIDFQTAHFLSMVYDFYVRIHWTWLTTLNDYFFSLYRRISINWGVFVRICFSFSCRPLSRALQKDNTGGSFSIRGFNKTRFYKKKIWEEIKDHHYRTDLKFDQCCPIFSFKRWPHLLYRVVLALNHPDWNAFSLALVSFIFTNHSPMFPNF